MSGLLGFGIVCIWTLAQNKPAEQIVVDNLNMAVSNYTDMNIKDDKTYSLKVSDVQMLVTTYSPEYTLFGASTNEYTARPSPINETLTTEGEQDLPACSFESVLLYDEKTDRFYNKINNRFRVNGRNGCASDMLNVSRSRS